MHHDAAVVLLPEAEGAIGVTVVQQWETPSGQRYVVSSCSERASHHAQGSSPTVTTYVCRSGKESCEGIR